MAQPINIPAQIDIVKVNGIGRVSQSLNVSPQLSSAIVSLDKLVAHLGTTAKETQSALNFSTVLKSGIFKDIIGDISKTTELLTKLEKAANDFTRNPSTTTGNALSKLLSDYKIKGKEAIAILESVGIAAAQAQGRGLQASQQNQIKDINSRRSQLISQLKNQAKDLRQQINSAVDIGDTNLANRLRGKVGVVSKQIKSLLGLDPSNATLQQLQTLDTSLSSLEKKAKSRQQTIRLQNTALEKQRDIIAQINKLTEDNARYRRRRGKERESEFNERSQAVLSASVKDANGNLEGFLIRSKEVEDVYKKTGAETQKITKELQNHVLSADKFGQAIALAFKRFAAFLGPSALLLGITFAIRNAIHEALEFEKVLTRIRQVTNAPREEINPLGKQLVNLARDTGVSSLETGKGLLTLAQAGFSDPKQLASVAEKLVKVPLAPTFDDISTTLDGLLAIFGQFNKQLSDTGTIFDQVNQFAADFAIESKDIFEIVKRGGATFSVAGGSFEEFLRLASTLRETTRQTPETIGTFFKTGTAELLSARSQQLLRGLGVQKGNITEQTSELAKVFGNKFGASVQGPEAVVVASELVGNRQLDKLLGLLRGLNDPKLQKRLDEALVKSVGSFDRSADQRLNDIGQSLDRIREAFGSFFKLAANNQDLRNFTQLIADLAQGVSKLSDSFGKNVPQFIAFSSILASPFLREVYLGAKGRLFGLRGKQLNTFLDTSEQSIRASISGSGVSPVEVNRIVAERRAELAASVTRRAGPTSLRGFGRPLLGGALLAGGALLSEQGGQFGAAASSGLTAGVIAGSLGFGPLGIAVAATTLATYSLSRSFIETRKAAIDSATSFAELNKALEENDIGNYLDRVIGALKDLISGDFNRFANAQGVGRGDQIAISQLLIDDIVNKRGIGVQAGNFGNRLIGQSLRTSNRDLSNADTAAETKGLLTDLLSSDVDFLNFIRNQGIDPRSRSRVREIAVKIIEQSSEFTGRVDKQIQEQLTIQNDVEKEVNKARGAILGLQQSSINAVKKLTESLDQLSSIITNPLELVTARLKQDPLEALKGFNDQQLKSFGLDPKSTKDLVSFADKFLNTYLSDITNFLTDQTQPSKLVNKTLGQARTDLLRSILNDEGADTASGKRLATTALPSTDTGVRRFDIIGSLRQREAAKALGFFDEKGNISPALKGISAVGSFKNFESDTQAIEFILNSFNSLPDEINNILGQARDRIQKFFDVFNKRLEIERQIADGMRETNNQLFEFSQRLQDLRTQFSERNITFGSTFANRFNPNATDAQTVRALRAGAGSSFGSVQGFSILAQSAASSLSRNRSAAQELRISGGFDRGTFELERRSLSEFQDVQAELTQRLNESNTRIGLLSRVTDILRTAFERLRGGVESVGQTLLGTSQLDFATGIHALTEFAHQLGTSNFANTNFESVGNALNNLGDFQIDNLVRILGQFQDINLGGGVTGGKLLSDITQSIALPAIATVRSSLSGKSTETELQNLRRELSVAEQQAKEAQAQENLVRQEQLALVQLQQSLAAQNITFFQKQTESLDALSSFFSNQNDTLVPVVVEIGRNVGLIAEKFGGAPGAARGGIVRGGIPNKDSVPIVTAPGEFIVNSFAAKKHSKLLDYLNAGGNADFIKENAIAQAYQKSLPTPANTLINQSRISGTLFNPLFDIAQSVNNTPAINYAARDYGPSRSELISGQRRYDKNERDYNNAFDNLNRRYGGNTKNTEFIRYAGALNRRYGRDNISNKEDLDRYISQRTAIRSQENQSKAATNQDSVTQATSLGDSLNGTLVPKFDELITLQRQMVEKLSSADKGSPPKFELTINPISVNVALTAPDILKMAGDSLYKAVVVAMKPKLLAAFRATGNQESVSQIEGL